MLLDCKHIKRIVYLRRGGISCGFFPLSLLAEIHLSFFGSPLYKSGEFFTACINPLTELRTYSCIVRISFDLATECRTPKRCNTNVISKRNQSINLAGCELANSIDNLQLYNRHILLQQLLVCGLLDMVILREWLKA